jgi:formylglycine-generating enzyme required for sulfatase activity
VNQFIRAVATLLLSACLAQSAVAQFFVTGPGFLPDENGTNLDDPQASKAAQRQKVAPGTVIKDCPECPEMVVIPAGSFVMGSSGNKSEQPIHRVTVPSFVIGKTEVTQGQWKILMGTNPSRFPRCGDDCPIDNVDWNDVNQFINKLNQKTGQHYRLPSESEWEYAARAGTTTRWSFGNNLSSASDFAWYGEVIDGKTHPVGLKLPNDFGLYDTLGNLHEWTQDCWHDDYAGAPTDGSAWTNGSRFCNVVVRGGSWGSTPDELRSAYRYLFGRSTPYAHIGFRLARDL